MDYTNKLVQKYANLTRKINERFINIHPIQRGGILTPEAHKALINFGDGYSICDNCMKGRIDMIENPPVSEFYTDLAKYLNIDEVIITASARESKRIVMNLLSKKFPKRRTVVIDSLAHYTTYLAIETNNLINEEVPNSGAPEYNINPEDYRATIEKVKKDTGESPLLVLLTHVDYKYGNYNNPKPIGEICKEFGIPFLLNGAYSVGTLPIDCKKDLIDFVTCSGHKSMAASGPIGVLGYKREFHEDIINLSQIKGNLTSKAFGNKICNVMGCPPVYGAPLITLMASFPEIVRRTQKNIAEEEAKKANYVLDEITKIKGFKLKGKYPKIHPLTNISTEGFAEVARTHPRKGFFVRDEFKERGIIGMLPGISKDMKYSTYGLTWEQIKYFANAFREIAEKYNLI
ncbi:MAG: O-phospho-L-seryl-tRNA:Cys-tRNA synthase [Promethearchaeota archaeon]